MPQKSRVNQFVAHLCHLVAMVICELANQRRKRNEEQAAFNAHFYEMFLEVQADLPGLSTLPALNRVHKALDWGRELIAERKKF